jgi:hypothetical protein
MKKVFLATLLSASMAFSSCMSYTPPITDAVDRTTAIIFGRFEKTVSSTDMGQAAITLINQETKEELALKCIKNNAQTEYFKNNDNPIYAVKIKPGKYRFGDYKIIDYWGNLIRTRNIKSILEALNMKFEFKVEESSSYYIGDFIIYVNPQPKVEDEKDKFGFEKHVLNWGSIKIKNNYDETRRNLFARMPKFSDLQSFTIFE